MPTLLPIPSLLMTEAAVMGSEIPEPPLPSPPPLQPIILSSLWPTLSGPTALSAGIPSVCFGQRVQFMGLKSFCNPPQYDNSRRPKQSPTQGFSLDLLSSRIIRN